MPSEYTGQNLPQPFCLAIFGQADNLPFVGGPQFLNRTIGRSPLYPKRNGQRQQAKACVQMLDDSQRFVLLLVGGWE